LRYTNGPHTPHTHTLHIFTHHTHARTTALPRRTTTFTFSPPCPHRRQDMGAFVPFTTPLPLPTFRAFACAHSATTYRAYRARTHTTHYWLLHTFLPPLPTAYHYRLPPSATLRARTRLARLLPAPCCCFSAYACLCTAGSSNGDLPRRGRRQATRFISGRAKTFVTLPQRISQTLFHLLPPVPPVHGVPYSPPTWAP